MHLALKLDQACRFNEKHIYFGLLHSQTSTLKYKMCQPQENRNQNQNDERARQERVCFKIKYAKKADVILLEILKNSERSPIEFQDLLVSPVGTHRLIIL